MTSEAGEALVELSVWLALFLYPLGLVGDSVRLTPRAARWVRRGFALGGVFFLIHVVTAFWVHYDMSHSTALEATALQALEVTGVAAGSGLYLNYAFALLWCVEAAWWSVAGETYRRRPLRLTVVIHSFFVFMILNGAVVFVPWPRRLLGCVVLLLCCVAVAYRRGSSVPRDVQA